MARVLQGLTWVLLLATVLNIAQVKANKQPPPSQDGTTPSIGSAVERAEKVYTENPLNPAAPNNGATTEKNSVQAGARVADDVSAKTDPQLGTGTETGTTPPAAKETISCLEPISVKVLRAEEDGISALDSSLSSQIDLLNNTGIKVFSVDYLYSKRLLFFAAQDKIYRNELAGRLIRSAPTLQLVTTGVDGPLSLAVDWEHDRIYWLSTRHRTLEAADLDGANRTTVIDILTFFQYPNNIVLDPYDEYLFLVSNNTIYRSNLKGKNLVRINLEETIPGTIKTLAVDIIRKRVFFTGRASSVKTGASYIASCDYSGKQVKQHPLANTWNDIYSIDVFQDTLYFAHFKKDAPDELWTADLNAASVTPIWKYSVPTATGGIWSVRVYHPGKQDLAANSCKDQGN